MAGASTPAIPCNPKETQSSMEKSHTCEEGGARISVSPLLMNLKKQLLNWPIKNVRISIFTLLYLKKQQRKTSIDIIILHLCT